jgi:hypothetical protein
VPVLARPAGGIWLAMAGVTMHHALALIAPIVLLVACDAEVKDTSCGGTCAATEEKFKLSERTVHDFASQKFVAEGITYTLLRVEYGDTPECDEDDDCTYSTYCGFVVDKVDFPLEVEWVADADVLFDAAEYCEDGELEGCELPGWELPIFEDEAFDEWMWETDSDDDILIECFLD